jgi:hypothetical protein
MIPSYPALVANPRPTLKLVVVKRRAAAAARHDQHSGADVLTHARDDFAGTSIQCRKNYQVPVNDASTATPQQDCRAMT